MLNTRYSINSNYVKIVGENSNLIRCYVCQKTIFNNYVWQINKKLERGKLDWQSRAYE